MSYLRLSNETTDSCDYKIYLSNPFNQDYYRQIRITSTDYGASASSIKNYVVYKNAPDSGTSHYVRGVVDDGMSAGRTYTLYAYAQAANGTWYLAGEDTITTLDNSGGKYDYGFKSVEVTTEEPHKIGDEIEIVADVKNYKSSAGPDYKVEVRDKNGALLNKDYEKALDGKDSDKAFLYPVIELDQVEDGYIEYTVSIKADESGWTEVDDSDNEKTIEIQVIVDGDDSFSSATTISFGEIITGTIDQYDDQDYYLIDDIPSDCDAFIIMIDYDDVPHDGDYDCNIYAYDKDRNKMGKVNGTVAGLTYMVVPTTGSRHYVRVDFDGDFISKEKQQYNLSTMAISTISVEQTHNINTAAEIHEWDHFLETIKGDEKDYYKITPVHDNKLRFVVQADTYDDDYLVTLLDKNKNELDHDKGSSPLTVEYDLEEGKQYYIEVAPETTDCFTRSRYLMHVEIDGVGGGGVAYPGSYERHTLENMPLTELLNVSIPADLSKPVSVMLLPPFKKITYQAGVSTESPNLHTTFNFDNDGFQGVSINGISYTFGEDNKAFALLGDGLANYFHNKSFHSVTISTGDISYDKNTNTISITEFQIQDSKQISSGKYVYTRLSISESINLDDLLLALALALVGVAIIAFAPGVIAAAASSATAAATLAVLGNVAAYLAPRLAEI